MKIIIIGAQGMLGQELASVFSEKSPLLWDREEIDIADELQVQEKIGKIKPDLVINAAAYNNVDAAENNADLANKINGFAVGYLAKAIKASGGILVHYSTDYVFKGDKKEGYEESDQPNPQSAYARSKYLGEQELQKNSTNFYLIRLSKLFGKPAVSRAAKRSFIEVILESADKKEALEVVDSELSSPTYAPDLAERTKEIIEQAMPFGIYHGANAGACTWFEFAEEIFKIKNNNIKVKPVPAGRYPRPAKRPDYSVLINTKLPQQRSWQEALREYLLNFHSAAQ